MNLKQFALLLGLFALTIFSCSEEENDDEFTPLGIYTGGIIVSNEGPFTDGVGSISYVSYDFGKSENNVFENINDSKLGAIVQSVAFNGDLAYIVSNVSNRIDVVDRETFKLVATIDTGLSNPRYIAFANGKGYVTNWGDGKDAGDDYVAIIDLTTNTLEKETISVVEGPEEIVVINNKVFVAHQGGWNQNDQVSVIDATTNVVSATITVGDVPNSMQVDGSGDLWVLCGGATEYDANWNVVPKTNGALVKIKVSDNTITTLDFTQNGPSHLLIENENLYYYLNGSVYKMSTSATTLPTTAEITDLSFYSMAIKDGILYGTDTGDNTSNGTVVSYDLTTNTKVNTATVGITPGGVYFN